MRHIKIRGARYPDLYELRRYQGDGLRVAQKFELLLGAHRRPDGRRWTGQQRDEAAGGVVPRSYVTNLHKNRIENPGYEKVRAIAGYLLKVDDSGRARPLLMLNYGSDIPASLMYMGAALERGYNALIFDEPGQGPSPPGSALQARLGEGHHPCGGLPRGMSGWGPRTHGTRGY